MAQTSEYDLKLIDSTSATKQELYIIAKSWIANSFKSAKDVIQLDDKESGRIILKGIFNLPVKGVWTTLYDYIHFTATIDIKEGKYRILFTDMSHHGGSYRDAVDGGLFVNEKPSCGGLFMSKAKWKKIKDESILKADDLIKEFNASMKKANVPSDF